MPRVPSSFSAYPVTVTLDGTGAGAIRFQAVGANLRVNNISVRVSTSVKQATATIYKGQIGDSYRISGTNSGSTGDSVSTPTDIFDGEALIVVWSGGDAAATATATFSGTQIPFDDYGKGIGGANWTNPVAAGDGSLIYPSLKSPNYITSVTGWMIGRDGSAEFNNVTVRGAVYIAGSGTSYIQIISQGGQPQIQLMPNPPAGLTFSNYASIYAAYATTVGPEYAGYLQLQSPSWNNAFNKYVTLTMTSQFSGPTGYRPRFTLDTNTADGIFDIYLNGIIKGLYGTNLVEVPQGYLDYSEGASAVTTSGTTEVGFQTLGGSLQKVGRKYTFECMFTISGLTVGERFGIRVFTGTGGLLTTLISDLGQITIPAAAVGEPRFIKVGFTGTGNDITIAVRRVSGAGTATCTSKYAGLMDAKSV